MIAGHVVFRAAAAVALLHALDAFAGAPTTPVSADLVAFVKQLPAPGPRDRAFLDIPAPVMTRLAIDPAAIRSVDPGLVCEPTSQAANMFQATLGHIGQVNTVCTQAGWSQGILTLVDGTSYMTTCGDPKAPVVTGSADITIGTHSWHGSASSQPSTHTLAHSCSGWAKVGRS
jgi:hypothetical protein